MKSVVIFLMIIVFAASAFATSSLVAYWNFEGGSTADLSGHGVAADGILSGGAAVVNDPLGQRGGVLYIPLGGKMATPAATEPKFDTSQYSAISMWVYAPAANSWFACTAGKGNTGSPRMYVDTGIDGKNYFLEGVDFAPPGSGGIFNTNNGWTRNSGWHQISAQIYPFFDGSTWGLINEVHIDGTLVGTTFVDSTSLLLNDFLFAIAPNANWTGYVDDVVYTVPEPCTIALLGIGAALIRRKK